MKDKLYLNCNMEINLGINRVQEKSELYSPMIIVSHDEGEIVFKCDAMFENEHDAERFLARFVVAFRQGRDETNSKLFPQ